MKYLAIKGWEDFQHYADRSPPWIKLHRTLLSNYEYLSLSEAAQSHLVKLWLLASEHDNRIPLDLAYITGKLQPKSAIDIDSLVYAGFITIEDSKDGAYRPAKQRKPVRRKRVQREADASKGMERAASAPLASRKRGASPRQRRGETETETEKKELLSPALAGGSDSAPSPKPPDPRKADLDALWQAWVSTHGAIDYGRFRKALAPLYPASGEPAYRRETLVGAITLHGEWVTGLAPGAAKWETVERWAGDVVRWARLAEMPLVEPDGTPSERARMLLGAA